MQRLLLLTAIGMIAVVPLAQAHQSHRRPEKAAKSSTDGLPARRIYDDRDRNGWYPRDAEQLKFGSQIWFEQMAREGRFGPGRRSP